MIAFTSFHCPSVFLSCSQPMVPNVFLVPCIYAPCTFHFLSCSFHVPLIFMSCHFRKKSKRYRQPYLCFTFTLYNFPPFLLFFQFLSCPSDVPLVSHSVRLIFLLIFLSCPFHFTLLSLQFPSLFPSIHFPFFLYVLSFFKIISNFRAYSFQIMFMVLGSFHDPPCSFMHRGANSLFDNVQQF